MVSEHYHTCIYGNPISHAVRKRKRKLSHISYQVCLPLFYSMKSSDGRQNNRPQLSVGSVYVIWQIHSCVQTQVCSFAALISTDVEYASEREQSVAHMRMWPHHIFCLIPIQWAIRWQSLWKLGMYRRCLYSVGQLTQLLYKSHVQFNQW